MDHVTHAMYAKENEWYVDSGASNHMTHHMDWFDKMQPKEEISFVHTGDDTKHADTHVGNVPIKSLNGKNQRLSRNCKKPCIRWPNDGERL